MRPKQRTTVAAGLALATVVGLGGAALADGHGAYPSQQQVDRARADVAAKKDDVAAIRKQLADAQAAADRADTRAEIASERYNGAMWRLAQARKAARAAAAAATRAQRRVAVERSGIAHLVVQSYQAGTDFNTITAVLGAEGPAGLMNRTSVVRMAGASMQADFDRYTRLNAAAQRAQHKAASTAAAQARVADSARADRAAAGAAAEHAQALADSVATHRDQLIHALAKAEHTSVALATQRQHALEEIARRKAEAEARRKAAAARRAAERAQQRAERRAEHHAAHDGGGNRGGAPTTSTPPASPDASAAIRFAKDQLGEPYQWGAAGPGSWDCSGLTMMAWRQGGIYLPHFSGAQYDAGTPISISDAQPGDLLFWSYNGRPSGIHHVALYLGGGEFIEAPHTGADVRYNSIYDEYPNFAVRL